MAQGATVEDPKLFTRPHCREFRPATIPTMRPCGHLGGWRSSR